jgi:hypothetical protein
LPLKRDNHPAMIKHVVQLFLFIGLFASCADSDNSSHITTLAKALENANKIHVQSNELLRSALQDKLSRYGYMQESIMWSPRIEKLRKLTVGMLVYMDGLKKELFSDSINKDRVINDAKAHDLFLRLFYYKQSLMHLLQSSNIEDKPWVRDAIRRDSVEYLAIIPAISTADTSTENEQTWFDSTFNNANEIMCKAIFNTIENNILISENLLLDYFNRKSNVLICGQYEQFSPIVTLSSSHVKVYDSIEVTLAIGSFTSAPKPSFFIDGKKLELTDRRYAVYSFRPKGKPGKYTLPVKIEYYKPDGTSESVHKNIPYTVVD